MQDKSATLSLCAGCLGADAPSVQSAVQAAVGGLAQVRLVACMNVCGRPVTVAFRAPGRAAWLFAGVDPQAQAADLAAFAGLWAAAPEGVVADARPAGGLRLQLLGMIPA